MLAYLAEHLESGVDYEELTLLTGLSALPARSPVPPGDGGEHLVRLPEAPAEAGKGTAGR